VKKKTKKKKKKKKREPWGSVRLPAFIHIKKTAKAMGIAKYDDTGLRKLIHDLAARPIESFPPHERGLHPQYVKFTNLTLRSQKGFMTQLRAHWSKVVPLRLTPEPPPNAVSAKPPTPPLPPNAVSAVKTLVERFADDWETVYVERAPLQSHGVLYGDTEESPGIQVYTDKVCISIRYTVPEDQDKIIDAIQRSIQGSKDPFSALIAGAKHCRTESGLWVDLLVHYDCPIVDLYKHVLKCELVKETHAKPAADFGVTSEQR
jgi:hypothetical protein